MQIVSISSLKGGVGKTSVTLGLASAALESKTPALVIDLDPHADASTALGVHAGPARDIGSLLRKPKKGAISTIATPSPWTQHPITPRVAPSQQAEPDPEPVLDVAAGSARSSHLDRSAFKVKDLKRLETLLRGVQKYDLVLIDCPPSLSALTRMAWAASHVVLPVAEPSLFSVAGTQRTMTALAQFEASKLWAAPAAGVVINRTREELAEHQHRIAELNELFGDLVVQPTLPDAPVLQQVQGAAWPVHRWPGHEAADLAGRYTAILEGLLRRSGS